MAIAFGSLVTPAIATGSDATSYATASFTPTANALLIAAVEWERIPVSTIPTCSGGSLSWSTLQDGILNTANREIGWFWAATGGSPGSMTVTIDFAGQTQIGAHIHVFDFTGAHLTAPRVQAKTNSSASATTISATLDAGLTAGSATLAIVACNDNIAIDFRATWTEIADSSHNTPATDLETQYRLATSETTGSGDKSSGAGVGMAIIVVELAIAVASTTVEWLPGYPAALRPTERMIASGPISRGLIT